MRQGAGLSQRELGKRLGVPHTWVAKVESGERRIDVVELGWFCKGCGADAREVLKDVMNGRVAEYGRPSRTRVSDPPPKTLTSILSRSTGRGGKRKGARK
jgi:transcriptional regulator with XRE-family HTH domain